MRLLIAEDAPDVAEAVAFGVTMLWPHCRITFATNGRDALRAAEHEPPDLVILDVAMPPPDGFEVCRQLRARSDVPILMLTVRDATLDKVRAFDLGADDYLTKPFDHLELLARLRALVRRAGTRRAAESTAFVAGDFVLDFASQSVSVGGAPIQLTPTEYRLLAELVTHAGAVLSHQVLLERVWGPQYVGDAHYLKVFIRRLRNKLGDAAEQPRFIHTAWGTGYRFVARPDAAPGSAG